MRTFIGWVSFNWRFFFVRLLTSNVVTARIRRMGEGNVLTRVCLSTGGVGLPNFQPIGGGTYHG